MNRNAYLPPPRMIRTNEVASWLAALSQPLALVSDTPALDAQALLAHVTGKSVAWLLAHPEAILERASISFLEQAAALLAGGEPLPYVLGHREFYGLDFEVTSDVLIPRPETELLVEKALAWLVDHPAAQCVADVGTGSGCIGITVAVHVPHLTVVACDRSLLALQVACRNAFRHNVSTFVHCFQGDLLSAVRTQFDLVCANLPYIPTETLAFLPVAAHEPRLALDGGFDGLDTIRRLLADAPRLLAPDGLLLLEIEAGQGAAALSLAQQSFPADDIQLFQDLGGHDRIISIQIS